MQPDPLPQNSQPINQASLPWLEETGWSPSPDFPYSFQLINWGFDQEISLPVVQELWYSLQEAAARLLSPVDAPDARLVLASDPEFDESPEEQEAMLVHTLDQAQSPREAARLLMEAFYRYKRSMFPGHYQDPRSSPPGWDHPNEPDN